MHKPRRSKPGNRSIAVAYLRVSTDDQRLGPEAQRSAIEAWAAREGVQVVAWHTDQGISGGSDLDDRPALVAAIGELRTTGAGVLAVAKRDRLARDVHVASTIERAVGKCGARVVAADGTGNGDGVGDKFMRHVLDAAAEYERGLIRARTKAALAAKKARGERAGELPFGYRLAADGRTLESEPREQTVLGKIGELRASGLALRAIVYECERAGIVGRSGRPLSLTQVARIARRAA